jgi:GNAT superfamily N-acetyltransferase
MTRVDHSVRLVEVTPAEVLVHRAQFSYAGERSPEQSALAGDDHPDSVHLLAFADGFAVGAATLTFDPFELTSGDLVLWRLRALGVAPSYQCKGIGFMLNRRRLWLVAQRGGVSAWCSARIEHGARFTRWGGEVLGPFTVAGSQAPEGTAHLLVRWDVHVLADRR